METTRKNILNNIIVKYAILAAALYIIYFLLMKAVGLAYHTELRYLNYVIYFIAGYYALNSASHNKANKFSYLQGIGTAFIIGVISFLAFAGFVFLYSFFNPFFTETIFKEYPSASTMGKFAPPFLIASEGIGFSAIFSLCLMQFFKIYTGRKRKLIFPEEKRNIILPE